MTGCRETHTSTLLLPATLPILNDRVEPSLELAHDRVWRSGRRIGGARLRIGRALGGRRPVPFVEPTLNVGERPTRGEIVGSRVRDLFELVPRVVDLSGFEQRAAECDAGG